MFHTYFDGERFWDILWYLILDSNTKENKLDEAHSTLGVDEKYLQYFSLKTGREETTVETYTKTEGRY